MVKQPASSPSSNTAPLTPHFLRSGYNFPAPFEDRLRAVSDGRLSDEQLHALVLFDHHLDAGRLNQALRLVMDSDPILGCRYNPHKNTWERRADLDQQNIWTVHVQTRRFSFDARPGVFRFVDSPRHPSENGVLEARIFRNGTDLLVLKAHHAITDAVGLKTILYKIAHTYNSLARDAAYKPKVSVAERDVYRAFQEKRNPSQAILRSTKWNFPASKVDRPYSPAISLQKVPLAIWHRLSEYAKSNYVLIEELFASAYYLALHETLGTQTPHKLPLILQKDLRPMLPTQYQNSIANLSAEVSLSIKIHPKDSAQKLLPQICSEFRKALPNEGLRQDSFDRLSAYESLSGSLDRLYESASSSIIPSLANYGELDSSRLQFDQKDVLDAYLVGPIQYTPRLHLTGSVFNESLTICARYCTSVVDTDLVEKLIHSFIAHLSDY